MKTIAIFALLTGLTTVVHAGQDGTVKLKVQDETVQVTIDGEDFAVYRFGAKWPKPFFDQVRAADGTEITRTIGDPNDKDHPHHKGIWIAVDEVNDVKFWAEQGRIVAASVKPIVAEGNPAKLKVVNQWLDENREPVLTETTTISIYANRLLCYDIAFAPAGERVEFHDTKEGLFGIRLRKSMIERERGKIVGANGKTGEGENWGRPNNWIDYYGEVDGKTYGAALFDHPGNFRPSRYHVRGYGLFAISPFGEKAYSKGQNEAQTVVLKTDESLRLRYGLLVHSGDTESANIQDVYRDYLTKAK